MSEADLLLREILERSRLVGRGGAGRPLIQLAIDAWISDRLVAFGSDVAESGGGGDEEPSAVPAGSRAGDGCVH